jgi:hypothetical protein
MLAEFASGQQRVEQRAHRARLEQAVERITNCGQLRSSRATRSPGSKTGDGPDEWAVFGVAERVRYHA